MKNLLFQLDTDAIPSAFDTVVAYDGGADHVIPLAGLSPDNCQATIEGTIYTRAPKHKRHTAIFVGGSNMAEGEALLRAVTNQFFSGFRVSVMLDSNGGNTTAAAAVALLSHHLALSGREVTVLAGTGPVGGRVAGLLGREGAQVRLASRVLERSQAAVAAVKARFGTECIPVETSNPDTLANALDGADTVVAAGKAGITLLPESIWRDHPTLKVLADVSTAPPAGIEGVEMMDKAASRHGKYTFGGIGIGALKLRVHRACVAALFEANDRVLDAEDIVDIAKELLA